MPGWFGRSLPNFVNGQVKIIAVGEVGRADQSATTFVDEHQGRQVPQQQSLRALSPGANGARRRLPPARRATRRDPSAGRWCRSGKPPCHLGVDPLVVEDEGRGVEAEVGSGALRRRPDRARWRGSPSAPTSRSAWSVPPSRSVTCTPSMVLCMAHRLVAKRRSMLPGQLLAQRLLQIRAQDAEQPSLHDLAELLKPQSGAAPSRLVQPAGLLEPVSELLQPRQHTHRVRGVVPRPREIDHVALRSRAGRLVQHHDLRQHLGAPAPHRGQAVVIGERPRRASRPKCSRHPASAEEL
jgi:hypothetical protein